MLDPTVATWAEELDRLAQAGPLPMVRLYPSYGGYSPRDAGGLFNPLARRKVIAQVVTQMEDPRRQHKKARIDNVPVVQVLEAAERHPDLKVLLCGAGINELQGLASKLPRARNLWAETSNADGLGAIPEPAQIPIAQPARFGLPHLIPYSGLAQVVVDLDDQRRGRFSRRMPSNCSRPDRNPCNARRSESLARGSGVVGPIEMRAP